MMSSQRLRRRRACARVACSPRKLGSSWILGGPGMPAVLLGLIGGCNGLMVGGVGGCCTLHRPLSQAAASCSLLDVCMYVCRCVCSLHRVNQIYCSCSSMYPSTFTHPASTIGTSMSCPSTRCSPRCLSLRTCLLPFTGVSASSERCLGSFWCYDTLSCRMRTAAVCERCYKIFFELRVAPYRRAVPW